MQPTENHLPGVHIEIPKDGTVLDVGDVIRGYDIVKHLGGGGFGQVYCAKRIKDGKEFALKMIRLPNGEITQHIAREISLMYDLHHENIVRLITVFTKDEFLFLVMELASEDLGKMISFVPMELPAIRRFLHSIIKGVHYLHERKIIHRDLKPANILIKEEILKLADFGISRPYVLAGEQVTPLEATPDFSAPELLMGSNRYTTAIDMWSIGCIFVNMLDKESPFDLMWAQYENMFDSQPISGTSRARLVLKRIFKKLGTPTEASWAGVTSLLGYPGDFEVYPHKEFETIYPLNDEGRDLLNQLLNINPHRRITAAMALQHPFLRGLN